MDSPALLVAAVAVVPLLVAAVLLVRTRERIRLHSDAVSGQTGPDREPPARRLREVDVRPLEPEACDRYTTQWQATERLFADAPARSLQAADDLVVEVMRERGYPVEDYDQRTGVILVDHGRLVDDYRTAHDVATSTRTGHVTADEMRRAMAHFRSLFDELLGGPVPAEGGLVR